MALTLSTSDLRAGFGLISRDYNTTRVVLFGRRSAAERSRVRCRPTLTTPPGSPKGPPPGWVTNPLSMPNFACLARILLKSGRESRYFAARHR